MDKKDPAWDSSLPYQIFLASPDDVADERNLARRVIEQVRGERAFRSRWARLPGSVFQRHQHRRAAQSRGSIR
jgi:hypothetical protein